LVVPTDTIKNTLYVLAHELDVRQIEAFAWTVACHFLDEYEQVTSAEVTIESRPWRRTKSRGEPHPHVFLGCSAELETCAALAVRVADDDGPNDNEPSGGVSCGLSGLALMKTTESGFRDFYRDKYTTLPDTDDRIFATTVEAGWTYDEMPDELAATRKQLRETLIEAFGASFSPSVQATLFEMGSAVLAAVPEVESIHLSMPNQHRTLVNLEPFGIDNENVIFMPSDEPFGNISAEICRDEPDDESDNDEPDDDEPYDDE
jgi:urate oxidase